MGALRTFNPSVVTIACAAPGIGVGVAAKRIVAEERKRIKMLARMEKGRSLGKRC